MNQTHEDRLEALSEKLAEVFLEEADPALWSGAEAESAKARTEKQRGNRQWDVKNANQVGLLFARALELRQRVKWTRQAAAGMVVEPLASDAVGPPADPEADIARFEREASRVMERLGARGAK